MRLSEEDKRKRIEKLCKLCDRKEDFNPILAAQVANPYKNDKSPENFDPSANLHQSFSKQVLADVQAIIDAGQNKGINDWGERCRREREKKGLSPDEIAKLFEVDRKTIQDQEKKVKGEANGNKPIVVDWFYLAAYSLLFRMYPYDLLEIENPHFICPMSTLEDSSTKYAMIIFGSLFDENDPEKLSQLDNILTIAKMSKDAYALFQKRLNFKDDSQALLKVYNQEPLDNPSAKAIIAEQLDNSPDKVLEHRRKNVKNMKSFIQHGSNTGRIYLESTIAMQDLIQNRPDRLRLLAQLALGGETVANLIKATFAAYPVHPKSLTWYYWGNQVVAPRDSKFDPKKYGDEVRRIQLYGIELQKYDPSCDSGEGEKK